MKKGAAGYLCPACEQLAEVIINGRAFCGNDCCRLVLWDPTMTLEELFAVVVIREPDD